MRNGDGLWDGDEARANLVDLDGIPNIAITDPADIDTDDDELNDGMEARGWTVGIHWERTMEHKETRDVYSNPTVKDTDGDGIKDYFEFINGADPTGADTDGDGLPDNIEINPTDGTQVSNPIGIEGEPPTMSNFYAEPVKAKREFLGVEYDWYKIKISFTVFDSAGLDHAIVEVIGIETKWVYFDAGVDRALVEVEFDPDEWKSLVTGYDVKITVYDDNGNGGTMKRHIKSVMETLVEAFVGALTKIAKAITELASKAIDWIWVAIKKMLDGVLKPIVDAAYNYVKGVVIALNYTILEYVETGSISIQTIDSLLFALTGGTFGIVLSVVLIILDVVTTIVTPFFSIISGLLALVTPYIIKIVIEGLGGVLRGDTPPTTKEGIISFFESLDPPERIGLEDLIIAMIAITGVLISTWLSRVEILGKYFGILYGVSSAILIFSAGMWYITSAVPILFLGVILAIGSIIILGVPKRLPEYFSVGMSMVGIIWGIILLLKRIPEYVEKIGG